MPPSELLLGQISSVLDLIKGHDSFLGRRPQRQKLLVRAGSVRRYRGEQEVIEGIFRAQHLQSPPSRVRVRLAVRCGAVRAVVLGFFDAERSDASIPVSLLVARRIRSTNEVRTSVLLSASQLSDASLSNIICVFGP